MCVFRALSAGLLLIAASAAFAQQPAADSSANPAKPKKVFTNDDVAPASSSAASWTN
jgi:hypothetical protein